MRNHLWAKGHCCYPQQAFRRIFTPIRRPVPADSDIVTAYTDGTVTLRRNRRLDGYHEATDLSGFQGVEVGDFVVHGLDILRGSIGISDSRGAITSVCIVCVPRAPADLRYFAYAMRAQAFTGFPRAMARGVREGGADFRRWDTLGDLPIPVPTLSEQQAIAEYLDMETAQIDALIVKKQHMIGLAVERLRALITTLTEGGPDVQVRRLISLRTSGPRGWAGFVTEIGAPFIRSANLQRESIEIKTDNLVYVTPPMTEEAKRSAVREGDVLVGITGANTGWVGCVPSNLAGSFVSQHVAILRPTSVEPQWLAYSLFSQRAQDQLLGSQYGGTKQQLGLDDLAELRITCPDRKEQLRRTKAMASAHLATKKIVTLLEGQIELLKERRQTLITAAVTGELKIPAQEAVA